jgi:hypothetical protein
MSQTIINFDIDDGIDVVQVLAKNTERIHIIDLNIKLIFKVLHLEYPYPFIW